MLRIGFVQCLQQALISKDSRVEHYFRFALNSKLLMSYMILILQMISYKEWNVEWPMEVYGLTLLYSFG